MESFGLPKLTDAEHEMLIQFIDHCRKYDMVDDTFMGSITMTHLSITSLVNDKPSFEGTPIDAVIWRSLASHGLVFLSDMRNGFYLRLQQLALDYYHHQERPRMMRWMIERYWSWRPDNGRL